MLDFCLVSGTWILDPIVRGIPDFTSNFVFSFIIDELEEYSTIQAFRLVVKNYPHYLSRPEKEKYFAIKRAAAYGVMFLSYR